jgi:hypothetical protein
MCTIQSLRTLGAVLLLASACNRAATYSEDTGDGVGGTENGGYSTREISNGASSANGGQSNTGSDTDGADR